MNPVIVIPSYWADTQNDGTIADVGVYDHACAIDADHPELENCLSSLDGVRGVVRVVVLLVSPPRCEQAARARVEEVCRRHALLNPLIIGSEEAAFVARAIRGVVPDMGGETVSLRGYGAIRNMGLVVAAVLGHDIVVFMDDDEVALTPDYLVDAVYGIGQMTRQNVPVVAKSGYFLDKNGSPFAKERNAPWYDKHWIKRHEFNAWMKNALDATRISRSSYVCGGCLAIHAEAFTRVAFDPFITRGEDLDYLFDLRMYGLEMWFDNEWRVRHLPPPTPSEPSRFLQDVYRWDYEREKLAFANRKIELNRVTVSSLMPYPGPWVSGQLPSRVLWTALFRAIGCPQHRTYFSVLTKGRKEAHAYATEMRARYLSFQTFWPRLMSELWGQRQLAALILKTGQVATEEGAAS